MADPNTIYKMTILTMLSKAEFPLSNTQISNFFLEQDYTDYFTVQQAVSALLDAGLIRPESTRGNTFYHITGSGKQTLRFFEDKITPAIQKDIKDYFEKNKVTLKNENSVTADFYKSSFSGFDARCQLKENDRSVIDLTIHVKTKEQAEAVCQNWKKQNAEIFSYLMDTLIR